MPVSDLEDVITQQIKPVWPLFCERAHGFLKNHFLKNTMPLQPRTQKETPIDCE